jgi:hypothetical protein
MHLISIYLKEDSLKDIMSSCAPVTSVIEYTETKSKTIIKKLVIWYETGMLQIAIIGKNRITGHGTHYLALTSTFMYSGGSFRYVENDGRASRKLVAYFRSSVNEKMKILRKYIGGEPGISDLIMRYMYGDSVWDLMYCGRLAT